MSRWEYFTEDEMRCKCGCGEVAMNESFMKKLIALRFTCNFPFPITSAYRCAKYNAQVSSTGHTGPHTTGRAVDIAIRGDAAFKLVELAQSHGFTGIGVKQHGMGRYIHLDDLTNDLAPRPTIWSYP